MIKCSCIKVRYACELYHTFIFNFMFERVCVCVCVFRGIVCVCCICSTINSHRHRRHRNLLIFSHIRCSKRETPFGFCLFMCQRCFTDIILHSEFILDYRLSASSAVNMETEPRTEGGVHKRSREIRKGTDGESESGWRWVVRQWVRHANDWNNPKSRVFITLGCLLSTFHQYRSEWALRAIYRISIYNIYYTSYTNIYFIRIRRHGIEELAFACARRTNQTSEIGMEGFGCEVREFFFLPFPLVHGIIQFGVLEASLSLSKSDIFVKPMSQQSCTMVVQK